MTRTAVIVAGGKGLRMESDIPKQFLELDSKPVLMRTVEQFHHAFDGAIDICLVLPSAHQDYWKTLCTNHSFEIPHTVVDGGETRFDSVKNGLQSCTGNGIVGIHDGVRPLVSIEMIRRCYSSAEQNHSALPVIPVTQSLRKKTSSGSEPLDRDGVLAVQTPQCFRLEMLRMAYTNAGHNAFTDDATVFEANGNDIALVVGEETNIKITTKADLKIAEAILSSSIDG